MRKTLFLAMALGTLSLSAATVDRVMVRQMWPWNGAIRIEYKLSGVTAPVDLKVSLAERGTPIALPTSAFSGGVYNVSADGVYAITVTPTADVLPNAVKDLSVKLEPVAPSSTEANVIYRVYDLDTGACENVTVGEILSGNLGAWHWADPASACLKPGEANDAAGTNLVWTGFNSDDVYKTSKLVMRYLPAKGALVHILNYKTSSGVVPDDFWVAVYETTQAQWTKIHGTTPSFRTPGDLKPASNVKYDDIRGAKGPEGEEAKYYWPNNPDPDSFLGKLRTKTGAAFDLPSQAVWEYAGQVNSRWATCNNYPVKGAYNTNVPFGTEDGALGYPDPDDPNGRFSWPSDPNYPGTYKGNASTYADVGSYAPSVVGLYDFHGNVGEFCVDWSNGNVRQSDQTSLAGAANVDLDDPTMMKAWNTTADPTGKGTKRMIIGSNWSTPLADQTPNYTRSNLDPGTASTSTGFRVVIMGK